MPSLPGTTAPTATPPTLGTTPRRCSYTGRPIYLAPTPISFPTSTALQALGFENACALQSLVLDGPFELIPLLTTLRQLVPEKQCLRRLSLKNTNCMRREVDKVDPRDDGRFLAQIALEADHYNNDRLKRLVDSLPTFVHRNVESVRLGDVALTFLTHRCGQQLTTLELTQSHSGKIQSRTLQTFLRSATGLKHLRTKGGVTLQVEDMLDSANHAWVPWACTGLETLSIAFGVAGPSTLSPLPPLLYNSSPVAQGHTDHLLTGNLVQSSSNSNSNSSSGILESSNGSIIHHAAAGAGGASMSSHNAWAERMVYKQLSLLTRIRVLDIRQSFLRLQTGTGIELLSSLRQLREFSIAGSDAGQVTVTKEMDAWFRQNWPSIDKIVVASRACALNTTGVTLPSRLLPMTGPVGPAIGANGDRRHSC
ncbi:hypothetical protein BGX31_008906 [Mortierella sp. GBA43]|nr:hypothetical protein BGX31_008906 [Mortierella sp. GBA43]